MWWFPLGDRKKSVRNFLAFSHCCQINLPVSYLLSYLSAEPTWAAQGWQCPGGLRILASGVVCTVLTASLTCAPAYSLFTSWDPAVPRLSLSWEPALLHPPLPGWCRVCTECPHPLALSLQTPAVPSTRLTCPFRQCPSCWDVRTPFPPFISISKTLKCRAPATYLGGSEFWLYRSVMPSWSSVW